jgi:glucokinase
MADPLVIGVDLGGTKLAAAVVGADGTVRETRERPTPVESEEALLAALGDAVEELLEPGVAAIGIGVPSRVDRRTRRAVASVNIPLDDVDVASLLGERFGLPVGIENDANAAAYAEWRYGAGAGAATMVMLTLGTGVGGGVVLDGAPYRGWAEIGHLVIDHDGPPCQGTCTGRGHLEALVSGTAVDALAHEAFGADEDARTLVARAREGDEQAVAILRDTGRRLGSGIGSLVNLFSPEVVVVGGGLAAAGELILEPAREVARREALAPAGDSVRVVAAELGNAAGLVGAALVGAEALAGSR